MKVEEGEPCIELPNRGSFFELFDAHAPWKPFMTITPPCCGRIHTWQSMDDLPERSLLCPCESGVYLIRYTEEEPKPGN